MYGVLIVLHCAVAFTVHNNIHEKFVDSDWLREVQSKCDTSAKSVTPVQKV